MIAAAELQEVPFFAALDDATLEDAARRAERRVYRSGEFVMFEGDDPPGLVFVRCGRVRLSRTGPDGREQVLSVVGSGEPVNAVPLFDGGPNPATARALTPVECFVLPRDALFDLVRRRPELAIALLRDLAAELRDLLLLVEDLAFRSVRQRMARQLLREAAAGDADLTQQELAERVGTVREIAGRALRQFAHEGLIRLARGRVSVLDPAGLARIAEGEA